MSNNTIRFPNLGIELHIGKSISIFGFEIAYYGIIIAIGMMLGVWIALKEAKRTRQNVDDYYDFAIITLVTGIIGARLYYVIFEWSYYKDNLLQIFNIRKGGLAIYGGIIASVITLLIFAKIRKLNALQMLYTAVLGLIIGQILGRWGNFCNREAFGGFYDGLFCMQIPLTEANGLTAELMAKATSDGFVSVHPTFLYESVWNLCLFVIMFWYRKRKKNHGEVFALYLLGYGIGRAIIEALRTDQLTIGNTGIAVSQVLSVILAVLGMAYILWSRFIRKEKKAE